MGYTHGGYAVRIKIVGIDRIELGPSRTAIAQFAEQRVRKEARLEPHPDAWNIDVARMMDVEPGDMLRCGRCRAFTICPWKRWNRRYDRRFEAARRAQPAQPIGDEYAVPWLATVRKQLQEL